MSNTLTRVEITCLPENTSRARELRWCMDFYKAQYAEAGSNKERAWKLYSKAVDQPLLSKEEKDEMYLMATMFDDICDDAWTEYENSKARYLELFN